MRKRVVITGLGTINPCGNTKDETWNALLEGKCGFIESKFPSIKYYGKVNEQFNSQLTKKEIRYMDRTSQLAVLVSREALLDSGITQGELHKKETIICFGTSIGGAETFGIEVRKFYESGIGKMNFVGIPKLLSNMMSSNISIDLGINGPAYTYCSACGSSTIAIGEAYRKIQYGDADIALAGGGEGAILDFVLASFGKLGVLSKGSTIDTAAVPFSKKRTGFVPGEGAAMLVLEEYESAVKRGADIYCEVIGYGATSDALSLLTPSLEGVARCMQKALQDANIQEDEVEYINAHGTSCEVSDLAEGKAISQMFHKQVAVSSTKSMHGHLLGGTGALEAVLCSLMIKKEILLSQINVKPDDVDQEFGTLNLLLDQNKPYMGGAVMSNTFGFGGVNATLIFNKFNK